MFGISLVWDDQHIFNLPNCLALAILATKKTYVVQSTCYPILACRNHNSLHFLPRNVYGSSGGRKEDISNISRIFKNRSIFFYLTKNNFEIEFISR